MSRQGARADAAGLPSPRLHTGRSHGPPEFITGGPGGGYAGRPGGPRPSFERASSSEGRAGTTPARVRAGGGIRLVSGGRRRAATVQIPHPRCQGAKALCPVIIISPAHRDVLGSRRGGGRLPSQPGPYRAIGMARTSSSRPGPRPTRAGLAFRHDSSRSPSSVLMPPRGTQNPMENQFGLVSTGVASSLSDQGRFLSHVSSLHMSVWVDVLEGGMMFVHHGNARKRRKFLLNS
jgi:hypothetical protein